MMCLSAATTIELQCGREYGNKYGREYGNEYGREYRSFLFNFSRVE